MPDLFDVVAVKISTGKVSSILAEGKTERNAEAIVSMAVARRGVTTEFYSEVPAGKFKEGDLYSSEASA